MLREADKIAKSLKAVRRFRLANPTPNYERAKLRNWPSSLAYCGGASNDNSKQALKRINLK